MSHRLNELKQRLDECYKQLKDLHSLETSLKQQIKEETLNIWLESKGLTIKSFPINNEMFEYAKKIGVPGTYIEYELDDWKPGTIIKLHYMYDSGESSIAASPINHHKGLFPPVMIERAINEYLKSK